MHLDWGGVHVDRLLPSALSLDRLRLTRTSKCSEKEITDYETIQPRRSTNSIHGIACLRTGHFRRLAGHSESGRPGNQASPANREERYRRMEGDDAEHRPEPGPRRR